MAAGAPESEPAKAGPALLIDMEDALRSAVVDAVQRSGLYVKSTERDMLLESVVAELQEGGLTSSAEEAHVRLAPLLDDLAPQAEPDDVLAFGASLHACLADAAHALALEQRPDDEEGGEALTGGCALCEREMPLTFHHLIPRDAHSKYRKRGVARQELSQGIDICRPCHSAIHSTYDNDTLATHYNTLEALKESEPIQRFVAYVRKQRLTRQDLGHGIRRYRR